MNIAKHRTLTRIGVSVVLSVGFRLVGAQTATVTTLPPEVLEGYPTSIARSLLERKVAANDAIQKASRPGLFAFVAKNFSWPNGSKLIVAFQGGNYEIWRDIQQIAVQWSSVANISFDFGLDPVARTARTYQATDPSSVAQVRINLLPSEARLRWSAVGREALLPEFAQASMELGGVSQTHPFWTKSDRADILHEFGHVLGFLHEHQRPECSGQYRLEPGLNGEPTIFDVYRTVYRADEEWVRDNLLLSDTYIGDSSGKPDKRSLFLYPIDDRILPATVQGVKGPCYIREKNFQMSAADVARARNDYPFDVGNTIGNLATANIEPLRAAVSSEGLSAAPPLLENLARMELAARPLVYIQVPGEEQRAIGERLRRVMLENRFTTPGVENISGQAKPPASAEVRYFSQQDRGSADLVAQQVAAELGLSTPIQLRFVDRVTLKKQPVEVWLPASR